jgi:hypothetical protein
MGPKPDSTISTLRARIAGLFLGFDVKTSWDTDLFGFNTTALEAEHARSQVQKPRLTQLHDPESADKTASDISEDEDEVMVVASRPNTTTDGEVRLRWAISLLTCVYISKVSLVAKQ